MSRYYTDAGTVVSRTRALASDIEAKEDATSAAFDAVQVELDRSLRLASGDAAFPAQLPLLSTIKGKYLRFNVTTGAPEAATLAGTDEMAAAVAAAASASASASSASTSATNAAGLVGSTHLTLLNNGII